jgi:hypothetical protein
VDGVGPGAAGDATDMGGSVAGTTGAAGAAAGTGGTGGAAAGTGGPAGSAGTIGVMHDGGMAGSGSDPRPLGAGCTGDGQCASNVCAKAQPSDNVGTCCNARPDQCSTCVGGYVTPVEDGKTCGEAFCGGPTAMVRGKSVPVPTQATQSFCKAGKCVAETVDCTQNFLCSDGASINFGQDGFCDYQASSGTVRCLASTGASFDGCQSLGHGTMK